MAAGWNTIQPVARPSRSKALPGVAAAALSKRWVLIEEERMNFVSRVSLLDVKVSMILFSEEQLRNAALESIEGEE